MNKEAKDLLEIITSKDLNDLTPFDIAFLKARRSYLNPSQRMAYEYLNLFENDKPKKNVKETVTKL